MVFNTKILGVLFFKRQLATEAQQKVNMKKTVFFCHRKINFNNENLDRGFIKINVYKALYI